MGWNRWLWATALVAVLCWGAGAQTLYVLNAHGPIQVFEYDAKAPKAPLPTPDTVLDAHNMTIHIDYRDGDAVLDNNNVPTGGMHPAIGFAVPNVHLRNERRARLEETLRYLARVLNVDPALDIVLNVRVAASLDVGPPSFLAQGGTPFASVAGHDFAPGFALQKLTTGTHDFPEFFDMRLAVDFGHNWYFGTCEPAGDQMDFRSVLLHEFTHGLGFTSFIGPDGQTANGLYTVFDGFVAREADASPLLEGAPPAFTGSVPELTSNALVFNGPSAFDLFAQGGYPPLHAPDPFVANSSIAHWSPASTPPFLVGGGVMEPFFFNGNVLRNYRPVDLGVLIDMGYERIDEVAAQEETTFCPGKPTGASCHAARGRAPGAGTADWIVVAVALCVLGLAAKGWCRD